MYYIIKATDGQGNDASLCDMMHLLRKYDVFGYAENDAMFAKKSLGEAVIIHEVNIISETTSFAKGKHH